MTMIKPRCRYCGCRVTNFGDICDDCGGDEARDDFLMELTRAQDHAILERMSE